MSEMINHHLHATVHWNKAIFELVWPSDCIKIPTKISRRCLKWFKSYRIDKQTDRQTDTPTNRHYWKQYHLCHVIAAHV